MPKLIITTRQGETRTIDAAVGMSIMEALRDSGVEVLALCGGACSCATCQVHVDREFAHLLPTMSGDEDDLLSGSSHRDEGSRLSCQIRMSENLSGLRLTVAQED